MRHWIGFERIARGFDRQCGAARQADARVIAGAGFVINAIFGSHRAQTLRQLFGPHGFEATLAFELTLALCHHHLQPFKRRCDGFLQSIAHLRNTVVVHGAQPLHAHAF